jgi:hypothetical protein
MARPAIRTKDCNYQVPNPLKGLGASASFTAVTGGGANISSSSGTKHTKCSPSTGGYCYVSPYNKCINDWVKYNNAWRQQRGRDALAKLQVWYDQMTAAKAKTAAYILGNAAELKIKEQTESSARAAQAAADAARAAAAAKPKSLHPKRDAAIAALRAKEAKDARIAAHLHPKRDAAIAALRAKEMQKSIWGELLGQGTMGLLWKLGRKSA